MQRRRRVCCQICLSGTEKVGCRYTGLIWTIRSASKKRERKAQGLAGVIATQVGNSEPVEPQLKRYGFGSWLSHVSAGQVPWSSAPSI